MTEEQIQYLISIGENIHTEFKRCGNGIGSDVYETVCSFSNRFGGDILCGVLDDGKIEGVPEKSVPDMIKNFTTIISNPQIFNPTLYLVPEIVHIKNKVIICVHVPLSSDVHSYKGKIYDRLLESDIVVKSSEKIAEMVIRKQDIFTEQKLYPYATMEDLRTELIEKCRQLAVNRIPEHPWKNMTNEQILRSAGLLRKDVETGKSGINRAGLLLLGKDDIILSICPQYKTDAIVRKYNLNRYDDREIIQTNLIDSFELLMQFSHKHLIDKFYLEGIQRVSLRDKIVREVISNILMHREFTSPYVSKFVIEKEKMYTENPCKAINQFEITPENFTPVSKNPLIAKFFSNIGYADELGSGTRNLFHYTNLYSGENPRMLEDNIFKTIIPLHDEYSADYGTPLPKQNDKIDSNENTNLSKNQKAIVDLIQSDENITQIEIAQKLSISRKTVQNNLKELCDKRIIEHIGAKKNGVWKVL